MKFLCFWGNDIFVGSNNEDSHGNNAGSVYVYEKPTTVWLQTQKLLAQSGVVDQNLGNAVSISGNRAIIGAEGDTENGVDSGAAYVFEYNAGTWGFTTKILPNDGNFNLKFGHDVSLDGDRVIISSLAIVSLVLGSYGGSAYIFDLTNGSWNQTVKLVGDDDQFYGDSVSLFGDRAVVGDTGDTVNGSNSGLVYVYDLISGNWLESFQLIPNDGFPQVQFGQSLSLSNDRLLVGSGIKATGFGGSAYIFDFNLGVWSQTDKLEAFGLTGDEHFGAAVSLSAGRSLVGAYSDINNNTGVTAGAAYIFEVTGSSWNQVAKIYSSDGEIGDLFARSIFLQDNRAVIGVPGDNDNGTDSGSAIILKRYLVVGFKPISYLPVMALLVTTLEIQPLSLEIIP
ncbi:MAG: hypothetical protein JKY19_04450 [Alcanivoracaceae bacterium]|nr:hypothetical protein [Alcanivoracaceae bacterium]